MTTDYESVDFFADERITRDPFPYLEYLRSKSPVQDTGHRGVLAVTGYAEAVSIFRDPDTFSACNTASGPFMTLPELAEGEDVETLLGSRRDFVPQNNLVVTMDPPLHTRERALLMRLLTPLRLKENEAFIRHLADRQIDRILDAGRCDFVNECAHPYSVTVIADLLGVPEADHHRFRLGFGVQSEPDAGDTPAAAEPAAPGGNTLSWLYEWFTGYVEERRQEPKNDVLTGLAQAKYPDGSTPDIAAVVHHAAFLFAAGGESTADMLAIAMKYLTENPDLQAELRAHRERIPAFIEECLRIDAPIRVDFRLAKRAATVGGVDIAPGTTVAIFNGAVNRDPRHFESPDQFDASRSNAREHLSFGRGIHSCPGAPLARAEGRILVERMVTRTRNIRLSEEHHGPDRARRFEFKPALTQRSLLELHIVFDRAEPE